MGEIRMKAAVLRRIGEQLEVIQDIELPELRPGQVLVRMVCSGVCHSQLMEVRGRRGADPYLPHLLGHEGSGVVIAIGSEVTKVSPGQSVVLTWIRGDGCDAGGSQFRCNDVTLNAGGVTTFNDHAVVSENRVIPLPDGVPMDVAALLGCAVPTGAGLVLNELQPEPGDAVAVFGIGGVGASALMAVAALGCRRILAVDVSADKLQLARKLGATNCIDARTTDPVAAIRALTDGHGVDRAFDASGRAAVIEQAFAATRRGGLCLFASHPAAGERISIDPYDLICGKRIQGSWGGGTRPDRDIPRFADLYRSGRLPLDLLLSRRYELDEINEALDDLEAGRTLRPIIVFDHDLADRR
jgi:S-(hydroxymethyl)glutathione dehydrogenase/alcohol dehydrogenase